MFLYQGPSPAHITSYLLVIIIVGAKFEQRWIMVRALA